MKKLNTKGFSAIEAILILVIVGIIGFVGWYVWNSSKKTQDDTSLGSQQSTSAKAQSTTKSTAPVFNKLPDGWTEYKNESDGLRLGFPKEWGVLDTTTLHTPDYQDTSKDLQGRLTIVISQKDGYTVVARKYGATIKPSSDGKSWIVSDENPAKADNYNVGDTYKTKTTNVNGGTAIDLSFVDEECTQTRWLLELKNTFAVITIPELCAGFNGSERTVISEGNKATYNQLITDFLKTFTVY